MIEPLGPTLAYISYMLARPVEIPMARAQAHLAMARYPLAIGAFRAALGIDPMAVGAHLGLATALAGQGRRSEAVDGLVAAAEAFASREERVGAMSLLDKALDLDPARLELDIDIAMLEEAMGRHDAAVVRVESLAERYMDDGRTDEAAELLRFLATWEDGEDEVAELPAVAQALVPEPIRWQTAIITGETVIARNPLLDLPKTRPEPQAPLIPETAVELDAIDRLVVHEPDLESLVTRVAGGQRFVAMQQQLMASEAELESSATRVADSRRLVPVERRVTPSEAELESSATRVADPRRLARRPPPAPPAKRVLVEENNPVVDRLRARAGFHHAAAPRPVVAGRGTEAITLRPLVRAREEDVTVRYRRPRAPMATAS